VRLVFLSSVRPDLDWFVQYYTGPFPEGAKRAKLRYMKTKELLKKYPEAGRPSETEGLRELVISNTPFMFVYEVKATHIEILRLWDQRARRPKTWRKNERTAKA
jgi:toxin ParE1/3/4